MFRGGVGRGFVAGYAGLAMIGLALAVIVVKRVHIHFSLISFRYSLCFQRHECHNGFCVFSDVLLLLVSWAGSKTEAETKSADGTGFRNDIEGRKSQIFETFSK